MQTRSFSVVGSKNVEWASSGSKAPPKRCLFSIPPPSKDCSFPLGLGRERLWVGILKGRYINFDWLIDWLNIGGRELEERNGDVDDTVIGDSRRLDAEVVTWEVSRARYINCEVSRVRWRQASRHIGESGQRRVWSWPTGLRRLERRMQPAKRHPQGEDWGLQGRW